MVSTSVQRNISLELDRRLPMEALVLNRLAKIPMARQDDWLRGLLVAGFRVECQVLKVGLREQVRSTCEKTNRSNHPGQAGTAYAQWLAEDCFIKEKPDRNRSVSEVVKPLSIKRSPSNTRKPFADLRKVIG